MSIRAMLARNSGERFAEMATDGGYRLINSFAEPRGILEWQPGARGFDLPLDGLLMAPLDESPLPRSGSLPRHLDPPGFIARRIRPYVASAEEETWQSWLTKLEVAFEYLEGPFLSRAGIPELNALASLEALEDAVRAELRHRAGRAALYTERARRLFCIPMVEAAAMYRDESISEAAVDFEEDLQKAWPSVCEGDMLKVVTSELRKPRFSDDLFPTEHWESQLLAIEAVLHEREPELSISEDLAARLEICQRIKRAAAHGVPVIHPAKEAPASYPVLLAWEIRQRFGLDTSALAGAFPKAKDFFEWSATVLRKHGAFKSEDYDSLRRKMLRDSLWTPISKGPSKTLDRDLAETAGRLHEALERWKRWHE